MRRSAFLVAACLLVALGAASASAVPVAIQQVSSDPFTNPTSQHETEVEADTFAFANTVVASFQAGRFELGGGSSGIGFATSTDAGQTWTSGFLPSLTVFSAPPGTAGRATDPTVGFDSTHGVWLISSLTCAQAPNTCNTAPTSVVVSRSTDGISWSAPVMVSSGAYDKEWLVCDNSPSSPFKGRCYVSWIDGSVDQTLTSTSTDGGQSWGPPVAAFGMLGVQPVVQPDGTLIILGKDGLNNIRAIRSTNGGASFSAPLIVATITARDPTGMRAQPLPSAEVDGAGKVYVAWQDCRFRAGCPSTAPNDIVMSTSADGVTWSSVQRIPIDKATSFVDHFIPGIGVDPTTSGAEANIGLVYYFFPLGLCAVATCELNVGFVSSNNGGKRWRRSVTLNPEPMSLSWLANTGAGRMVGDYASTSFAASRAVSVFSIASAPDTVFHQGMYATAMRVRG